MSLTKLTKEVDNISALSDYPNSTEGLSSQDLKERFDKASVDIKDYINTTLTDELDTIHANYEETLATKEEVDLDYLKKTDAEATYETIENIDAYKDEVDETYLKKTDASSIYLTQEDASEDYLTKQEASTTYDTISNVANIYATKQALAEAQMGAIVDQSVTKQKLSLDVQATLDNAETNIDGLVTSVATINGKIPSEASTTNQLADKDYVDGRVQENTANFIGRFDSIEELEAYAGTLTNNDYAYVVTQVVGGNDQIVRYKWNATTEEWVEEFDMNSTIFTESQLDTINSGLTASDKGKIENVTKYNIPSVEKVQGEFIDYRGVEGIQEIQLLNSAVSTGQTGWEEIVDYTPATPEPYIEFKSELIAYSSTRTCLLKISLLLEDNTTKEKLYEHDSSTKKDCTIVFDSLSSKVKNIKAYFCVSYGGYTGYCENIRISGKGKANYSFQNAFTLDNNTTFTNNQRVLVETPKPPQIILSNQEKLEEKTWQINGTNTTITSNDNITITTTRGNSNLINFIDGDISTRYTFTTPQTESTNIIIDLLNNKAVSSLQLYIKNVINYANKLYYSLDGNNWKQFYDYSVLPAGESWVETIATPIICRFIKIESTNNDASVASTSFYEIKCTINDYTIIGGMTIDGVSSNTLNGIDIPTLLQPSTKYELVYDEDSNKFKLGGGKTLIDITFTEKTYVVDLSAIKLKKGKLYMFRVTNTSATAYLAKTSTGTDIQVSYFSLICPLDNGTFTIITSGHNYDTTIDEIKYIYSSAGWNAGCRLVLMEV